SKKSFILLFSQLNVLTVNEDEKMRLTLSYKFSLSFKVPDETEWFHSLINRIDYLIQTDFPKLLNILYSLDVSETKLSNMLKEHPGNDAAEIIARLIIERQREKINSRTQNKKPDEDIPDDEKW